MIPVACCIRVRADEQDTRRRSTGSEWWKDGRVPIAAVSRTALTPLLAALVLLPLAEAGRAQASSQQAAAIPSELSAADPASAKSSVDLRIESTYDKPLVGSRPVGRRSSIPRYHATCAFSHRGKARSAGLEAGLRVVAPFFVAPSGSDSNPGTEAEPRQSKGRARSCAR